LQKKTYKMHKGKKEFPVLNYIIGYSYNQIR